MPLIGGQEKFRQGYDTLTESRKKEFPRKAQELGGWGHVLGSRYRGQRCPGLKPQGLSPIP